VPLTLGVWMPAEWERWFSFSIIAIFSIPTAQFLSRRTVWRDLTPDEFHARLLKHRHWFIFCVFSVCGMIARPAVNVVFNMEIVGTIGGIAGTFFSIIAAFSFQKSMDHRRSILQLVFDEIAALEMLLQSPPRFTLKNIWRRWWFKCLSTSA